MPIATCILAQSSDVDLSGGQFVSVANQPTFEACRGICLGMELQAENMVADLESLLLDLWGGCEMESASRQRVGVAMPMQHRHAVQVAQGTELSGFRQNNRPKADFLNPGRKYHRAESRRDELRAEADTESGLGRRKAAQENLM